MIHDLVRLDAGDTYAYDGGKQNKRRGENNTAVERIYGPAAGGSEKC